MSNLRSDSAPAALYAAIRELRRESAGWRAKFRACETELSSERARAAAAERAFLELSERAFERGRRV